MTMNKADYRFLCEKLVQYYEQRQPFDRQRLIADAQRFADPVRLYRVLCSCSYLGMNQEFCGGILTEKILRKTGWELPGKASDTILKYDSNLDEKLEQKCRKYISEETIKELRKIYSMTLPVEWRLFYFFYVPSYIFSEQDVKVNIKMYKKRKIKMYIFQSNLPPIVFPKRLAFL